VLPGKGIGGVSGGQNPVTLPAAWPARLLIHKQIFRRVDLTPLPRVWQGLYRDSTGFNDLPKRIGHMRLVTLF